MAWHAWDRGDGLGPEGAQAALSGGGDGPRGIQPKPGRADGGHATRRADVVAPFIWGTDRGLKAMHTWNLEMKFVLIRSYSSWFVLIRTFL